MPVTLTLKSPLSTSWTEQYVRLRLPDTAPGDARGCTLNGSPHPFQYTGAVDSSGAEVLLRLGFDAGQTHRIVFDPADADTATLTDFTVAAIPLDDGAPIGYGGCELRIPAPTPGPEGVAGPFGAFAGWPFTCAIRSEGAFEDATLRRIGDGALFTEYELVYRFAERRRYTLRLRCFRDEPIIHVEERMQLRMGGALTWTLNPEGRVDRILSHRGPDFCNEKQPTDEPIDRERPADILCRLQMPVLNAYFIPNNRGWFAFYNSAQTDAGMFGVVGVRGEDWREPVENMPEVTVADGAARWTASLVSGARQWLLHAGPLEREFTDDRRLVYHRLQAEWNLLRLDEHLDLGGDGVFDASVADAPAFFDPGEMRAALPERTAGLAPLARAVETIGEEPDRWGSHFAVFAAFVDPSDERRQRIYDLLLAQFQRWVRQWQGYRDGNGDYQKSVIGFSRWLRGMLLGYEILRRDAWLSDEQLRTLNAYFVFAARRICDEGRWPHSKSWKHPDHPESTRDFYAYGGEHKPDRLVWTNSLPNFQSDPLCALAQISAVFPDHPDALSWRRKAIEDIERQLDAYMGDSGAWEESINYALYTFSYFVITFRTLKQRCGIDYFMDTRVRKMADWLCRFFGPRDKRFDAWTWPGIGNAVLPQQGGQFLLAYASELPVDDPLRHACMAIYQRQEPILTLAEHYPAVFAGMARVPDRAYDLPRCASEHMDEIGVAMRHRHLEEKESYLFQKIGFWKDHYENDESAFNWYAKGTPLCMEYGTYTQDAGIGASHNIVEIPDQDALRRGYLAGLVFSPAFDYTHCEMPVTLKLLWGRVRTFEEIDNRDKTQDRTTTPYHYIGDANPVGPKTWKVRKLLFVKPDYLAVFDRVYGDVPHRYNLHAVADAFEDAGGAVRAAGRFDLDLEVLVQHPAQYDAETGHFTPGQRGQKERSRPEDHAQAYVRLYNRKDGIYRTLLFAKERERDVTLAPAGAHGMRVETPEYTDYVFLHDDLIEETFDGIAFRGRAGWIRREADGTIRAGLVDGDWIEAFGTRIDGMGPWTYNVDRPDDIERKGGPPRTVRVTTGSGG
ncbi:MAG: hypothetical protein ACOCX4_02615 [Planctomycetota bacterium]